MEMNMDAKTQELFAARAEVVKAMAHPTRLFIISELSMGERCVCELKELAGGDMSTVSKHLSVLKSAGIVEVDKRGLQVFYRLRCPCILRFFDCIENVLKENAKRRMDLVGS
jgi:DNA-binding transcriptional ArsR family regulator